ncbi:MAG: helix-turn-helix transcriptional regulator [Bacteroidales bacterium]|nr:helix-turn-helix transcriptional regulator [Bacteroidales bacterium]
MNSRLLRFLSAENISQSQFADTIGVARASISHILSGRNRPGFDFFEKVAACYPNLSLEWLITGKGKMYSHADDEADTAPDRIESPGKTISRIVVFFNDGTFQEYF